MKEVDNDVDSTNTHNAYKFGENACEFTEFGA